MRTAYLDYAMSVIVSARPARRRDGLKPLHRRILYTMHEMGCGPTAAYRKCAGIVGETMAKYHPHGDLASTRRWSAWPRTGACATARPRQGNFGSIDGDPPAAMRYTEARMASITAEMLADLDSETVDFIDNYDGKYREPLVLPGQVPQPARQRLRRHRRRHGDRHPAAQPREVGDALARLIDKDPTLDELMEIVPGPDFPTGGIICAGRAASTPTSPAAARSTHPPHVRHRPRPLSSCATRSPSRSRRRGMEVIITGAPYQSNKAADREDGADESAQEDYRTFATFATKARGRACGSSSR